MLEQLRCVASMPTKCRSYGNNGILLVGASLYKSRNLMRCSARSSSCLLPSLFALPNFDWLRQSFVKDLAVPVIEVDLRKPSRSYRLDNPADNEVASRIQANSAITSSFLTL